MYYNWTFLNLGVLGVLLLTETETKELVICNAFCRIQIIYSLKVIPTKHSIARFLNLEIIGSYENCQRFWSKIPSIIFS